MNANPLKLLRFVPRRIYALAGVLVFGWLAVQLIWAQMWDRVDVPLPGALGEMTFYRLHIHPFLAEYDRKIAIRLADGREIKSPLETNTGGRTWVLLSWQPNTQTGGGPFLLLDERRRRTWINLGRGCLMGSMKPNDMIPDSLMCEHADRTTSSDWKYFGRIDGCVGRLRFTAGKTWRTDVVSDTISLPGTGWRFDVLRLPDPSFPCIPRYRIQLIHPDGATIPAWFENDVFVPRTATIEFYPAIGSDGPYVKIGRFATTRFTQYMRRTLIDLRKRRAYILHRYDPGDEPSDPEARRITIMVAAAANWENRAYASYAKETATLTATRQRQPVQLFPLPEAVRDGKGKPFGVIHLETLTFEPFRTSHQD